jgi:uncharacterized protein (DUF362 family)/Pyruvate/2-oxoacid:ferredoxin oxidoreductase delta subunit
MNARVGVVRCSSYEPSLVDNATEQLLALLGGIEGFIKPKSKVLVKPNLLMAKEPRYGITTHPAVVRSVIKLLKGLHCKIFLGDGPSVWGNQIENINDVYESTGMAGLCRELDVELVDFDKRRWYGKFPLTTYLDTCDYLVNIPKFKTHNLTVLTAAIKNNFGLVSGTYKTELHKNYFKIEDFSRILVDVFEQAKPCLTVVDAITSMQGDGPATGGRLRQANLLLASADCVALDSVLALIMGIEPLDVLTTKEAAERGLGIADIKDIEILGQALEDIVAEPFRLPAPSFIRKNLPPAVISLAKKLLKYYPCAEMDNCVRCVACIKACPTRAIDMKNNKISFDYSKCIACFCCQESCPASAIKIKKSLLARIAGL